MATLRTPLEVALGHRLPLDFSDLDLGDYDREERDDEAREARLLADATETADALSYAERLDALADDWRPTLRAIARDARTQALRWTETAAEEDWS